MVEILRANSKHVQAIDRLVLRLEATGGASTPDDVRGRRRSQQHVRLDASQTRELVERYVAGAGVAELARRFGVHPDTVRAKVDAQQVRRPQRRLSCDEEERIRVLAAEGLSQRELARRFGVSQMTISRRVQGGATSTESAG